MEFIRRIRLLFNKQAAQTLQRYQYIRYLLEQGREAKRQEAYASALEFFEAALTLLNTQDEGEKLVRTLIHLHIGDIHIAKGEYDTAKDWLDTLYEQAERDEHPETQAYLLSAYGTLAQAQGEREKARDYYEQARELAQKAQALGAEGRAAGHLADTYLQEGNASYAEYLLRDALPKLTLSNDTELGGYFVGLLGWAQVENGNTEDGEYLVRRAMDIAAQLDDHRHERFWRRLLGQWALAKRQYSEGIEHFRRAIELYPERLQQSQDFIQVLCRAAFAAIYNGELIQAKTYAAQAQNLAEQANNSHLKHIAQGLTGMVLRREGEITEALPLLQTCFEYLLQDRADDTLLSPIEVSRELATVYQHQGDHQQAEAIYQQALALAEEKQDKLAQAHIYRDRGLLYRHMGRLEEALTSWGKALAIFDAEEQTSQAARLNCDIGQIYFEQGDGRRAIRHYERALMLINSIDDDATRGIVLANAAIVYAERGDTDSAEAFFKEAIALAQNTEDSAAEAVRRGNYGHFLIQIKRYSEAKQALERARELSTQAGEKLHYAIHTLNLGYLYAAQKNYEQAINSYQEALEILKTLSSSTWLCLGHTYLARVLIASGQMEQADSLLSLAEQQSPEEIPALVDIERRFVRSMWLYDQGELEAAKTQLEQAIAKAQQGKFVRLQKEIESWLEQIGSTKP
ncbi:MAG: tetratricopeptide repeat protein [Chloroflexi bacterium]|nr:MAG: tetratricopeptide repeat protein [Chloroflexota bacterium]